MKLSVIIVAYNVDEYIHKCVMSCLDQELDSRLFEVVIVNDGSTDQTKKILDELHQKNKDIVVIHQDNKGVGEARNVGLRASSGDYVWFVDGDDYIKVNCLSQLYHQLLDEKLDALVVDYKVVNPDEKVLNTKSQPLHSSQTLTGSAYYSTNYVDGYFWLFIFKKELFIKHDLKFMKRYKMQDSELLPKVLFYTKRLAFCHTFCYYYVQHTKSSTNSEQGSERYFYFESIIVVQDSFRNYFKDIQNQDTLLAQGLEKKLNTIDTIIFNHLLYFKYTFKELFKILDLLRSNDLYPLHYQPKGLKKILKLGLNTFPYSTNYLFNTLNKLKQKKMS